MCNASYSTQVGDRILIFFFTVSFTAAFFFLSTEIALSQRTDDPVPLFNSTDFNDEGVTNFNEIDDRIDDIERDYNDFNVTNSSPQPETNINSSPRPETNINSSPKPDVGDREHLPDDTGKPLSNITLQNPLNAKSLSELFEAILRVVIVLAIPVITLMIIYAGFLYTTARGNTEQVQTATRALTYAIIGGLLILGARLLLTVIQNTISAF